MKFGSVSQQRVRLARHTRAVAYAGCPDVPTYDVAPSDTVQVEADPACAAVIAQRAAEGLADPGPIFPDVRSFTWAEAGLKEEVAGICGGFPCQAGLLCSSCLKLSILTGDQQSWAVRRPL